MVANDRDDREEASSRIPGNKLLQLQNSDNPGMMFTDREQLSSLEHIHENHTRSKIKVRIR